MFRHGSIQKFILLFFSLLSLGSAHADREAHALMSARRVLVDVLRPRVRELDRAPMLFNYTPAGKDAIDVYVNVQARAERFFDLDAPTGGDLGPGFYAASDPVSGAYLGGGRPRLLAFSLTRGTRVLSAEFAELAPEARARVEELSAALGCAPATQAPAAVRDYADLIYLFRNSREPSCRRAVITALEELRVQALLYFSAGPEVIGCRSTGTAVSVIDPHAIAWRHANWYSAEQVREGDPSLKPMIRAFFEEIKQDFGAQIKLEGADTWARYRRAFDFFSDVAPMKGTAYEDWKNRSVLRCGPAWSTEEDFRMADLVRWLRAPQNLGLQRLIVRTAMAYNSIFRRATPEVAGASRSFRLSGLKLLRDRLPTLKAVSEAHDPPRFLDQLSHQFELMPEPMRTHPLALWTALTHLDLSADERLRLFNLSRLEIGQAPVLSKPVRTRARTGVRGITIEQLYHDQSLFVEMIQRCFGVYGEASATKTNISHGPCGVLDE